MIAFSVNHFDLEVTEAQLCASIPGRDERRRPFHAMSFPRRVKQWQAAVAPCPAK
jgi:hypothetical protein